MTTTEKATLALVALALGGAAWWLFRPETEEERGEGEAPPPSHPAWEHERFDPGRFSVAALPATLPLILPRGRDSANG